ncbi:Down syndrome critical region gene 1-like 1, isoform CRA_c [Rattus norvegicus]|uniref:Down syndrome critical region gene 1-like 1, isoform CRA_c n=1 Tax=Rattus norvegicus TaxID=10116 RepID=A6JJ22_RAT|nr:Down syndrome critical region gene 1-like 1, isoform CRA_c [Rattus norvegicus]
MCVCVLFIPGHLYRTISKLGFDCMRSPYLVSPSPLHPDIPRTCTITSIYFDDLRVCPTLWYPSPVLYRQGASTAPFGSISLGIMISLSQYIIV